MTKQKKTFRKVENFNGDEVAVNLMSVFGLFLIGIFLSAIETIFMAVFLGMFINIFFLFWVNSFKCYLDSIEVYYEEIK